MNSITTNKKVKEYLNISSDEIIDTELDTLRGIAYNQRVARFGNDIIEHFIITHDTDKSFELYFNPIHTIYEVYKNDKDTPLTVTTQYTIDSDTGELVITDTDIGRGAWIFIRYIPTYFQDAETLMACMHSLIRLRSLIDAGVGKSLMELIDPTLAFYDAHLQSFPAVGSARLNRRPAALWRHEP